MSDNSAIYAEIGKRALCGYRQAAALAEQLEQERDRLEAAAETVTDREAADAIDRLTGEYRRRLAAEFIELAAINDVIRAAGVTVPEELVIRKRYLSGLTIEQAAEEIGISDRYVKYLTRSALVKIGHAIVAAEAA